MKKTKIIMVGAAISCLMLGSFVIFSDNNKSNKSEAATTNSTEIDAKAAQIETMSIGQAVQEELSNYEGIGDIIVDFQQSVTIQTSIDSSDPNAESLAKDIAKKVEDLLKSQKLKSVSKVDSYKVIVQSEDEKKLN